MTMIYPKAICCLCEEYGVVAGYDPDLKSYYCRACKPHILASHHQIWMNDTMTQTAIKKNAFAHFKKRSAK